MDIFDYLAHRRMQSDIDLTRNESWHAEQATIDLEARVRLLERSTRALWSLLKDKTGWTDEELIEHAKALETAHATAECPSCGRKLLIQNASNCSWCGQRLDGNLPLTGSDSEA